MPRHKLLSTTTFSDSQQDVFGFFAEAKNLEVLTPAFLKFKIATPLPIIMAEGLEIDYALRLKGIPLSWRSVITHWEPPHLFIDKQTRGPYKLWEHQHSFVSENGNTVMRDSVEYLSRGWLAESMINQLIVQPQLTTIFQYRANAIASIFKVVDFQIKFEHS